MATGTWSQTAPSGAVWINGGEHALYPRAEWYHKIVWDVYRPEKSKTITIRVRFYASHKDGWLNDSGTTTAYISVNGDVSTKAVTTKGYRYDLSWIHNDTWYYTVEASSRGDVVMIGNGSADYALTVPGGDLIPVYAKVNGAWVQAAAMHVKVNGAWKESTTTHVKVNGSWKEPN